MGNSLGVIAIFKNESHILDEWINHYLKEGVCQFILINNGSTDNFMKVINPYMKYIYLYNDNGRPENSKENFQIRLYNKYFNETCKIPSFKKCKWYIVCDLDEFIYSKNPKYKTIPEYLHTLPNNIGQIKIPWKMFGSNGYVEQPKSVISSFTKRESYKNRNVKICCKSIIKSEAIYKLHAHSHIIKPNFISITSENKIDNVKDFIYNSNEESLFWSQLACNHYQLQSKKWYLNVKCTRGDAMNKDNKRTLCKFDNLDSNFNNIIDYELKFKKKD